MDEFYTNLLNGIIDNCMYELTGSDLKVLLYILRHTFGFNKATDETAISQLQHGIIKRDGTHFDYGTGLSKSTILKSISNLIKKDILIKYPIRVQHKPFRISPSIFKLNPIFIEILTGSTKSLPTVSPEVIHTGISIREERK